MMTVNEVSRLTGVSIRTLQYYDQIGLLHPTGYSQSGYRLYDDTALEVLQQILLFRELEFPLKEIRKIISSPNFDRNKALEQQITLLTLKKEHLENLILLARGIKLTGVNNMDFKAFDKSKLDAYVKEAKEAWGNTEAYREFEEKNAGRSTEENQIIGEQMMKIFKELGAVKNLDPSDEKVQALVKELQDFITKNYYHCTKEILAGLGKMYAGGGDFTQNIDAAGGAGTAAFTQQAIEIFCK